MRKSGENKAGNYKRNHLVFLSKNTNRYFGCCTHVHFCRLPEDERHGNQSHIQYHRYRAELCIKQGFCIQKKELKLKKRLVA